MVMPRGVVFLRPLEEEEALARDLGLAFAFTLTLRCGLRAGFALVRTGRLARAGLDLADALGRG